MFEDHNDTVYEIIKGANLLEPAQLEELNESHLHTGKSLADAVIDSEVVDREQILAAVAEYLGYEYLATPPNKVEEDIASTVQASVARMYAVVPYEVSDTSVSLLAQDPFNPAIIDDLTFTLNKDITIVVCNPEHIDSLLIATYGEEDSSIDDILGDLGESFTESQDDLSEGDLTDMANQTPIIRFVNLVLQQAIKDKASDVHFEPFEDQFRIRYRIDGALYEMAPPPKNLAVPVTSRVKVLSNMNISETRIPQDGRIKMTIAGRPVDLRVSTLPTQFGESVVLRVLDKSVVNLDLEALSLPDDILQTIRDLVDRPNGIFIVTGPTGSGKTTTLYSALREVNSVETKILTAEDPVEYEIDGIMQVAVNHKVGLDFSRALRAFLRQDPDKIMVGEIRDLETAQIAVQASLTGHVVLSTLHTNDAVSTITRILNMGVQPYLITSALTLIVAQRLARKNCTECLVEDETVNESQLRSVGFSAEEATRVTLFHGEGCSNCNETGYKGRKGVYEVLRISDNLIEGILQEKTTPELKKIALEKDDFLNMQELGRTFLKDGSICIEEYKRILILD